VSNPEYRKETTLKTLHAPIIIEMDEDGVYIVSCPLFKGCRSYGGTIDEAMTNIREAIDMCIEENSEEEPNTFVGFREMEIEQNA
jgi:predicted RNase H-like HicB family nuclease